MHNYIFLAGGSFQGKSLIALKIAAQFNYSGVVTTDVLRNILKVQRQEEDYLSTSTYLLSNELLNKQKEYVSNLLSGLIDIFNSRGERIIVEGMHFSDHFLDWLSTKEYLKLFINNGCSLEERIVYKKITRSKLSVQDELKLQPENEIITSDNVEISRYVGNKNRINEIHESLKKKCLSSGFELVDFTDLDNGINQCLERVMKWQADNF